MAAGREQHRTLFPAVSIHLSPSRAQELELSPSSTEVIIFLERLWVHRLYSTMTHICTDYDIFWNKL